MTDADIHDVARMLYEAYLKNAGQTKPLWDDLGKAGRSQWRLLAKLAAAEVVKQTHRPIQQGAATFLVR